MASDKGGRPKGSHDFTPIIRGGLKRALARMADEGKPISEYLYEALKEEPVLTLQRLAAYAPKETTITGKVEHDHQHTVRGVSETISFLESFAAEGSESAHEESSEDRLILPH